MSTVIEDDSTLTDRYQTTVPASVRRALKLKRRDRIHYMIRPDGEVVLTRGRDESSQDPVMASFLPSWSATCRNTRNIFVLPLLTFAEAERLEMIGILDDQHLGQQAGGRVALVDDLSQHRRLGQRLALIADPLAADMPFDGEHTRCVI